MTQGHDAPESNFHVLLEGAKVGPYNRRTIVGMRIKNTLTSDHVLVGNDGGELTVADLIGRRPPEDFSANRSGVFSLVRATFSAALVEADRGTVEVPPFKDEIEARVQLDVLRLAGRYRKGLGWKEDRVKVPLRDIVHARVRGSLVELWLRNAPSKKLQKVVLELFTPQAAGDLVEWLPDATAWPEPAVAAPAASRNTSGGHGLWVAIGTIAMVLFTVLIVILWPRVH